VLSIFSRRLICVGEGGLGVLVHGRRINLSSIFVVAHIGSVPIMGRTCGLLCGRRRVFLVNGRLGVLGSRELVLLLVLRGLLLLVFSATLIF
jgi:hypothetical protein